MYSRRVCLAEMFCGVIVFIISIDISEAKARIRDTVAVAVCSQATVAALAKQSVQIQTALKTPPSEGARLSSNCILWSSCVSTNLGPSHAPSCVFSKKPCGFVKRPDAQSNDKLRIVNGEIAKPHELPYQLALGRKYIDNTTQQLRYNNFCGASPLNKFYVITAAHCLKQLLQEEIVVLAGRHDISRDFLGVDANNEHTEPHAQHRDVESLLMHEHYDKDKIEGGTPNDIALIKLKTPLEFNQYVQPLELPDATYIAAGLSIIRSPTAIAQSGDLLLWNRESARDCAIDPPKVTVLTLPVNSFHLLTKWNALLGGWGRNGNYLPQQFLHKVDQDMISDEDCRAEFASKEEYQDQVSRIVDSMLCTSSKLHKSQCGGDSGGALVINNEGIKRVVGLVSFSYGCGTEGLPSVFTEVAFVPWIHEHIAQKKCKKTL